MNTKNMNTKKMIGIRCETYVKGCGTLVASLLMGITPSFGAGTVASSLQDPSAQAASAAVIRPVQYSDRDRQGQRYNDVRIRGTVTRERGYNQFEMRTDDGRLLRVVLDAEDSVTTVQGDQVEVTGHRDGRLFIATNFNLLRSGSARRDTRTRRSGTFNFSGSISALYPPTRVRVRGDNGREYLFDSPTTLSTGLQVGRRVRVSGTTNEFGQLRLDRIVPITTRNRTGTHDDPYDRGGAGSYGDENYGDDNYGDGTYGGGTYGGGYGEGASRPGDYEPGTSVRLLGVVQSVQRDRNGTVTMRVRDDDDGRLFWVTTTTTTRFNQGDHVEVLGTLDGDRLSATSVELAGQNSRQNRRNSGGIGDILGGIFGNR